MAEQRIETRFYLATDLAPGAEFRLDPAEQCGRLSVPEVREPLDLGALIAGWPAERRLLLCAETGAARLLAQALSEVAAGDEGSVAPWPHPGRS